MTILTILWILTRHVSPHGLLNEVDVNSSAYHIRIFGRPAHSTTDGMYAIVGRSFALLRGTHNLLCLKFNDGLQNYCPLVYMCV